MPDAAVEVASPEQRAAIEKIRTRLENKDSLDLDEVVKALAPTTERLPAPSKLPLPAIITESQTKALDRLKEVFGSVVPNKRRALTPKETEALMEERLLLDEIDKLVKLRKESLRTTLFNHWDVKEEAKPDFDAEAVHRNVDGHYILAEETQVPKLGKCFKREVRDGSPSLVESALELLAKDPDFPSFTEVDWLTVTDEMRVFNEHSFMNLLRTRPEVVEALARATRAGTPSAVFAPPRPIK